MCPNGGVSHVCGAEAPSAVVELKNKKLQNDKMKRNDSVVFSRRGANCKTFDYFDIVRN